MGRANRGGPLRRRGVWGLGIAGLVGLVLGAPGTSGAVVPPEGAPGNGHLEGSGGKGLRSGREVTVGRVPAHASRAWRRLEARIGPAWASWDPATGIPSRILAGELEVPGAVASPEIAAREAEALLSSHLDLLAPGARWSDFRPVSNHESAGIRSVGFAQTIDGVPVIGGQLSVRFKGDRLSMIASDALPLDRAPVIPPVDTAGADALVSAARAWIEDDVSGQVTQALLAAAPAYLPMVDETGVLAIHAVRSVELDLEGPRSRWTVYLDPRSAAPVARQQTLRFAELETLLRVPERGPYAARESRPAAYIWAMVDGGTTGADASGLLSIPDGPAEITLRPTGPLVTTQDASGSPLGILSVLIDGSGPLAPLVWDAASDEAVDAQLTTYVRANEVKAYVREIGSAGQLPWLAESLVANVNIPSECNAFWDSREGTINFFSASESCENTGRLTDVILHEFGHGIHDRALIPAVGVFDVALSEGISDYLAATIVNDPGMGRGFFYDDEPIRQLDPPGFEWRWPEDRGEVHAEGRIIGGTLWDLRKAFIGLYGERDGVARVDEFWFEATRRASDIPSMFFETLLVDDDDGNLRNGTPHDCAIAEIFGSHGLYQADLRFSSPGVIELRGSGTRIAVGVEHLFERCSNSSRARLSWRLRDRPEAEAEAGSAEMSPEQGGFFGSLPSTTEGSVLQYQIDVFHNVGGGQRLPLNDNDRWYETYVGEVEPVYCTDFERDPFAEGWTHGGPTDEWAWGAPAGASGDPEAAFSGRKVVGLDLGGAEGDGDGKYEPGGASWLRSPSIDVSGHARLRLQYRRWLEVEDGVFDTARVLVNGVEAWTHVASPEPDRLATRHHRDREWRFHDIEVSDLVADDRLQVTFDLVSDGGLEMGGWTMDDFCIVAYEPELTCGNGRVDPGEGCDDGNRDPGDGCSPDCRVEDDDGGALPDDEDGDLGADLDLLDRGCACELGEVGRARGGRGAGGPVFAMLAFLGLAGWRRRRG